MSRRTFCKPRPSKPRTRAVLYDTSIMRPSTTGPLSLIRTTTARPLRRLVTRTNEPKGNVGWAAVKACMSKGSPLAVSFPWKNSPYQEAVPTSYGLLLTCFLDGRLTALTTVGFCTVAASELFGPDAAPAPRLATDKSTARLSAKRRRIQLPRISKVVSLYSLLPRRRSFDVSGGRRAVSTETFGYLIN